MCPQNDEANEFPQFTTRTEDVTQMDPSLQDLVLRAKDGLSLDPAQAVASAETGEIWVDIIAKLKYPAREVPGLDVRVTIGQIVTGRARVQDIEAIHEDGNVLSLKASKPMRPAMERSVREIHADTRTLRDHFPTQPVDGSDVIVGLVDFGCDFCHQNFCTADGKSRLLYLWDQKGGDNLPDSPTKRKPDKPNEYKYRYGREYDKQAIDRALSSADPYWELGGYTPIDKDHGTHVLDIAAGNGRATGNLGVAPGADLIFVHLGKPDYTGEKSLGGSTRLLEAVEYIFDKADELGKPAVVNLSLATNGGPHDGSTMIDQAFDKKLEGKDNRAIVICAGNVYNRSIHCTGKVTSDQPAEIEWKILSRCPVVQEMEIWYSGKDEFKVEIVEPGGKSLQPAKLGEIKSTTIGPNNEVLLVRTVHRCEDSTNGDHQIDIFLYCHEHEFMTGDWKIILHPVGDITDGTFHSWIERDNYYASCFSKRHSDPAYTLGSIATGTLPIVVGSYDAYSPGRAVSLFSSSGPTRDGRPKPDISAPGESIKAARATTQTVCQDSGTSMAAPFVTGLIALMMQVAKEQGKDLSIQEIRDMLMQTARKDPPPGGILDLRYGAGRIDCSATIASLVGETVPVHAGADSTTARRALAVPASSSRFVPLAHELAGVATGANVRLRLTLELEPLAPGRAREGRVVTSLETRTDRERETHAVTPEEYIALLESATRNSVT